MRKLIAITQVSLDGVMQGPGGPEEDPSNGFTQGGWFMRYADASLKAVLDETMAGDFDLLLGRRTYDIWTAYWPLQPDADPIAKAFNKAVKYVITHRPEGLSWAQSKAIGSDVVEGVRSLKASAGPEIHTWGSSQALQPLIAAGLIDEYRFWVTPLVLGHGKRRFEEGLPVAKLNLVDSKRTTTGLLINSYRPIGV
jgi:dihydrofolate reductase